MKFRPLRLLVLGIVFVAVIFFLTTRKLDALAEKPTGGFSFSAWIQGQVLGISYEDRYCRHMVNNKNSKYPPVIEVAKQLGIKDGDTIFINGLHCGEWLIALKNNFPNLKLYGVDKDAESIKYVSKHVTGNFTVSLPYELQTVKMLNKVHFDHAIIDGVLSIYQPAEQCTAVQQMLPMLKAAGSLYIGKNFERCKDNADIEKDLQKYLHVKLLPKCYWSNECLKGRADIVEILYSQESNMFPSLHEEKKSQVREQKEKLLFDFSSCATSVFVHRHIVLLNANKHLEAKLLPQSKHGNVHQHECTKSDSVNSSQNKLFDKDSIRKAIKDMKVQGLDAH